MTEVGVGVGASCRMHWKWCPNVSRWSRLGMMKFNGEIIIVTYFTFDAIWTHIKEAAFVATSSDRHRALDEVLSLCGTLHKCRSYIVGTINFCHLLFHSTVNHKGDLSLGWRRHFVIYVFIWLICWCSSWPFPGGEWGKQVATDQMSVPWICGIWTVPIRLCCWDQIQTT